MDAPSNCLFITYVEKEGPFLKVWGQTDKNTSLYIEQVLHSFTNQFDNGLCIPHPESLQVGILCVAKYKDSKYYRARITSLDYLHNRYIEVNFVDYGHKDIVPITNIRSLEGFEAAFISIPSQASGFLLAEAVCPRGEWNDIYLDEISKEIRYTEVNYAIIAQVTKHYLVRLFVGVNDLALILISKGLMRHTSVTTQEAVLLSMMPRAPPSQQATTQQNIATYKAFTLEPGHQYEVYVSYVTDGPCNFSVQLKQSEEVLAKLMKEINCMTLTPIEGIPIPGTVCLARCMEDAHICRAVVTNEVDGQYKVFYVDFGNFEVVSLDSLYEIPFKFVIPKVMAIRFALAGIEKSTVTIEMQCAFKQFVDNRLIHMKVLPMTTRTSLPRCELLDPETHTSALDIVNQAASAGYPEHIPLNRGFSQLVKVSYVFSCNRFYVQLKSKEEELTKLMLDIQVLCQDSEPLTMVKKAMPCYALYEGDQQWYRSQIVDVLDGQVRVQYVDYGNEEFVVLGALKPIEGRQLTILRPQAIECCLNGYQNMQLDQERDNLLEELILEREFTMKVVEMQGKKALIELIDSANYNVASLLLDKIAVTRSQVSPMLVQAGNKIEHRKSQQYGSRQKPDRVERWTESSNENTGWRQDGRGFRAKSFDSNESNDNSWRQNNKGFNKNDRNKRDDLNDSTDSEKQSQKSFGKNDRYRNELNSRNVDGGSWKQNQSGFNKSQDRFSNKNEWGNGDNRKNSRDDWKKDNRRNDNEWNGAKEDWKNSNTGEEWGESKEDNKFKREDRGPRKSFSPKKDEWGSQDTKPFNRRDKEWGQGKQDSWGNKEDKHDNWKEGKQDSWGNKDGRRDNFKSKRFEDGGNDTWNSESTHKGGFKKRPDFKREASELSSSGSEKSFRKGFKDNRKPNFNKTVDRSPKNDAGGGGDAWNATPAPALEVPNPAPNTAKFGVPNVENTESNITISWFHNPTSFYCQLEGSQEEFKRLMEDIQQAYKGRSPTTAPVGAPIIGLFPEDKVLYRAEVVETIGSKFKVYYVDFGNVSVVDKVWPIETRFMELPAQAVFCKLSGVEPATEHWLDASSYGAYFNKKQFFCRFLNFDQDKVAVQLESNNEDIASALIRDGLAKGAAPVLPPELPLLTGQQFRAMLVAFTSLADFSLSLQSGVVLNCSVFNLSQSTETWEDNLKEKMEQILIVYVDDIKDKLEVTLYDQNGAKIKLIDKDEEAYESVELLCPYLIMYSSLSGEITHVEQTTVFIQPADCAHTVEYLINTSYELYENTPVETPVTPVENYVYAVKGSDENWYRGRVTKIEDGKVSVTYLDYGNCEDVEANALRELTAELLEIQMLSMSVSIQDAKEDLIGKFVTVNLTFGEDGLTGTIQEEQTFVEEVEPSQPQVEPPQPQEESLQSQVEPLHPQEEPQSAPESSGTHVILSHADSPSDFYLQLADSIESIEQLQATLQTQSTEMPDLENPVVGALCAAPYTLDQQWYRAQVLDADTDITTVRFVDYGNTDVLDNHATHIKTLPPELLSLEVHATRCRLKIKPVDEEWTSAASERFDQLCSAESLTVEFLSQDEKTNYVELFSNGQNICEILIKENLAVADEVFVETSSVGFVSHLNSPSEFWIQLENCVEELEWVAEQLSGAESFAELEDLAPGTLCAALFPDDQQWYRARILSNTVAGIEVLFVDYGNSCTSCSLRELPEDLVMLAPLAQKCSLQRQENLTVWGPEMIRKFREISAEGQTTFNVKKLSTGETAAVELLLDGVDVTTLLLPKTEDVHVKFEGLEELILVKGEEELGKYKLEALPDVTWGEESVKKLEELNNSGTTVFQAEFVSGDTVRLYLGLNDIRLDLNGVKTTTPTSSPLKVRSSDITHSENTGDEIKSMVECFVDSVINHHENEAFVESLVAGVVNCIDTNHESENDNVITNFDEASECVVRSILEELLVSVDSVTNRACVVDSILEELLEESTGTKESPLNEDIPSELTDRDNTNKTNSHDSSVRSNLLEQSTQSSDDVKPPQDKDTDKLDCDSTPEVPTVETEDAASNSSLSQGKEDIEVEIATESGDTENEEKPEK